jgi:hypothetical protein
MRFGHNHFFPQHIFRAQTGLRSLHQFAERNLKLRTGLLDSLLIDADRDVARLLARKEGNRTHDRRREERGTSGIFTFAEVTAKLAG